VPNIFRTTAGSMGYFNEPSNNGVERKDKKKLTFREIPIHRHIVANNYFYSLGALSDKDMRIHTEQNL